MYLHFSMQYEWAKAKKCTSLALIMHAQYINTRFIVRRQPRGRVHRTIRCYSHSKTTRYVHIFGQMA